MSKAVLDPDIAEAALSLGSNLATLHHSLSLGVTSNRARRFVDVFVGTVRADAATLGIALPPETFSDDFDPRVTDVLQRLTLARGGANGPLFRVLVPCEVR